MVRLLAFLALSATVAAQPELESLSLSSGSNAELSSAVGSAPTFNLTGGSADLVLSVSADAPGASISGISVTMSAQDPFGGTSRLTIPTIRSGRATVRFPLPRFLVTGTYRLNIAILDTEGRSRRWTHDELVADGFPSQFEVDVANDADAPTVSGLRIAPIADLSQPQGTVRLTAFDESGVIAYRVVAASPTGRRVVLADYQSNIGEGPGHTFESAFNLANGLRDDAPVEQGQWTIAEVSVTDSDGKSQTLTGRDLFNLEIQSRFAVGDVESGEEPGPACGAPNPVASGATVRVPASADVYDLRGRRVARSGEDGSLSTEGLARGIYLTRSATIDAPPCRFTVR